MQRQLRRIKDLVAVQAGHRYLGSWHQPQIVLDVAVQIVAELGQLARSPHGFFFHHKRRVYFGVALAAMQVEQPLDQRALELGALAHEHVEA